MNEVRILSNPNVSYNGEAIMGTMHIDNILAFMDAGTNDFTSLNAKVFPNPVADILNVDSQLPILNYQIYNILGSLVMTSEVNTLNTSIDVSDLRSGVYMIKLNGMEGSQTKRFVKSNFQSQ